MSENRRMVGQKSYFFLCLSKFLAQYQLARHLVNDYELIIWPHRSMQKDSTGIYFYNYQENKIKVASLSSDPQLYRNTHCEKGLNQGFNKKMQFDGVRISH